MACAFLQAVADITLAGDCVRPDKALCDEQCTEHETSWTDEETGEPQSVCLTECTKESEQIATAVAHALAEITVTDDVDCSALTDNGSTQFSEIIHNVRRRVYIGLLRLVFFFLVIVERLDWQAASSYISAHVICCALALLGRVEIQLHPAWLYMALQCR